MRFFRHSRGIAAAFWLMMTVVMPAWASAPNVLVTVRPLHSLVAAVMDGVATPALLLSGGQTPHSYALTPSDARSLASADLVVWVGEPLETFLEGPLTSLASNATVLELAADSRLMLRENREGGVWESEESHDQGEAHAHEDHHHGHQHGHLDGHVWLDPDNARVVAQIVAEALGELDGANAPIYQGNADRLIELLYDLEAEIKGQLKPVRDRPFLVAHDALQYFDRYFTLNAVGAVAVTPDRAPSARRLSDIRAKVKQLGTVCLFSEPGFAPKVMDVVAEAADIRTGILDPLGINLAPGAQLYFDLMRGLAQELTDCLS